MQHVVLIRNNGGHYNLYLNRMYHKVFALQLIKLFDSLYSSTSTES